MPIPEREVRRVLIALDITEEVVDRAIAEDYDLILSHHPLLFRGVKHMTVTDPVARRTIKLCRAGIAAFSFHTRLDALEGGVNDTLAGLLGLTKVLPFGDEGIGRIGELCHTMPLYELCERLKEICGAPFVLAADGGVQCRRVAILGGEGGDDIAKAAAAGADTYISGRLGYHNMTDAHGRGMNLIEGGHFYTEFPVCFTLEKMLKEIDPTIDTEIYYSNRIMAI
jgi:dinuclear metal center YbgI/SA1388 family protein